MRHRFTAIAAVLLLASAAWAADQVTVEDWATQAVGHKGIPDGWKGQSWGSPKYDNLVIVENTGKKVLHLKSQDDSTTINKDIKGKVRLKDTPILEWTWKSVVLPKGANSCVAATDDQAGQIFVTWPRFPEQVRSRIIGYVWDTTQPVGTVCKSEKSGMITYIVVRSGQADLGKWVTERRNVVEDFRKIYNDAPDDPGAVSVSIDSNDTHSASEAMMGTILFPQAVTDSREFVRSLGADNEVGGSDRRSPRHPPTVIVAHHRLVDGAGVARARSGTPYRALRHARAVGGATAAPRHPQRSSSPTIGLSMARASPALETAHPTVLCDTPARQAARAACREMNERIVSAYRAHRARADAGA